MKKKVMKGMPYAGNPHVRVVEGKVESAAKPRRWSLLYKRWINRLWDEDDGQVIIGPPMEYVVLALLVAIVTVVTCLWGWKVSGWKGVCFGLLATPFIVMAIRIVGGGFSYFRGKVLSYFSCSHETIDGCKWSYSIIGDHVKVLAVSPMNGAISIPPTLGQRPITSIEDGVFSGCSSLTSVTIPSSVTNIGAKAFCGCRGLANVTMPDSLTSIGDYAFQGCSGLTSMILPASVTDIGAEAFSGCRGLADAKGFVVVRNILFSYHGTGRHVTIPDAVTSIGDEAFCGCSTLMSVTIPNSVTIIGYRAFYGCSGLTSMAIPNCVMNIGVEAFSGCSGLADSEGFVIVGNILFSYHGTGGNVTIPDGVTSIGYRSFYGCHDLTSVTLPEGVASIEDYAFSDCGGLTSVMMPESIKSIGRSAFDNCDSLMNVEIPLGVTSVGDFAFSDCCGLISITLPADLKSCGDCVLFECYEITKVIVPKEVADFDVYWIGKWLESYEDICKNITVYVEVGTIVRDATHFAAQHGLKIQYIESENVVRSEGADFEDAKKGN